MIVECEQGSPEWKQARIGLITASMFRTARSTKKDGSWTAAALDYAFAVALERISGEPSKDGYQTWEMARGNALEPEARAVHAMEINKPILHAGIAISECGKFGASADGFIGEDGGAEYKCLIAPSSLREVVVNNDISKYEDQIYGGMWITGREWWDFCLYCPSLEAINKPLWRWRYTRNDAYIEQMERDLNMFDELVSETQSSIEANAQIEIAA